MAARRPAPARSFPPGVWRSIMISPDCKPSAASRHAGKLTKRCRPGPAVTPCPGCLRPKSMATVRAHRGTRNALHWQPHVSFREDAARNRKDHGPANIAVLRRRALDLARHDTSKGSLSIKLKRAGWNDAFLLSLLNQLATLRGFVA